MRPFHSECALLKRRLEMAFPSYRYIPGQSPHPIQHPNGHMVGQVLQDCQNRAHRQQLWAYGLDLFDAQYMWEAHEVWERLWHHHRHETELANHIQGMILCAAACLKYALQAYPQAQRLFERAQLKLSADVSLKMGVELSSILSGVAEFLKGGPPPRIVNTCSDGWRNWP